MVERQVTEVECFTTISSDDYALQFCILIPEYAVAVAEPALGLEVFVYLEVFFRKPDAVVCQISSDFSARIFIYDMLLIASLASISAHRFRLQI